MKHALATVSALALSAAAAQAQDNAAYELPSLTLYASETPTELSRTGSSVTVLTQEQIETSPETSLADTLDRVPGVNVVRNGAPGATTSLSIRGLPNQYAPVFINGIRVSDASSTQAAFNFGGILPGGVSRAEVVRGAQSALYGSDAIAGIVAIDLAKAPEETGETGALSVEYGAFGTTNAAASYGVAGENWGLAVTASRLATDGFSSIDLDAADDEDGYTANQYGFDGYFQATPDLRIGLSGFAYDGAGDYDSNDWTDPGSGSFETDSWALRAYAQLQTGTVAHELSFSRYDIERSFDAVGWSDEFGSTRDVAAYSGTWEASAAATLSFGLERSIETADFSAATYDAFWSRNGTGYSDEETGNTAAYAELAYAITPDVDATVSVRHDEQSEFGGEWSGRATLSWRATNALTLRGAWAKGYRAPSMYELFSPSYGNEDLTPETSQSVEFGADYAFAGGASIGATVFHTSIDDLIEYDYATSRYGQLSGTSVSRGLELSGAMPLSDRLSLTGGYTYTDARDDDDAPLQRVPRYDLTMGLDAQITDALSAGVSLTHKADFPDTYGAASTDSVDDFTVVNARFGYQIADNWEAWARVENLFDADYEVIPDYQTSGRAWYFGVRASF
ncbi:TonB-dependent receptor [Citreicella sp. C3M06]|uniref:TonB-dependent receptor plug domain-containing protein n=1 Tax=Citreicella sp. C3M06 TaxID=2841564 RepID=UPI001C07FEEB|nr:TonB-dependent receptor [Citreicella sp. C3M06]MBU2960112.1 TonB-dependent receptor [Citreicella sp. C3M06]